MANMGGAVQGAWIVGERFAQTRRRNPEGQMPLMEHLRELRNRLVKSVLVIIAGMIGTSGTQHRGHPFRRIYRSSH
jgi:hypothetical protein